MSSSAGLMPTAVEGRQRVEHKFIAGTLSMQIAPAAPMPLATARTVVDRADNDFPPLSVAQRHRGRGLLSVGARSLGSTLLSSITGIVRVVRR